LAALLFLIQVLLWHGMASGRADHGWIIQAADADNTETMMGMEKSGLP